MRSAYVRTPFTSVEAKAIAVNGIPGDADVSSPTTILLVRFKSPLSLEEITKLAEARAHKFQALAGLRQKYYIQDAATGEYGGVYLWQSPDDAAAYLDSNLRASIAATYQTDGEPRIEVFRVFKAVCEETA
jgi:hypothetical protein